MSNARKIADERFAKGEISKDEHAEIIRTLESGQKETQPTQLAGNSSSDKEKLWNGLIIGGLAGYLFIGYVVRVKGMELNQVGNLIVVLSSLALIVGLVMKTNKK